MSKITFGLIAAAGAATGAVATAAFYSSRKDAAIPNIPTTATSTSPTSAPTSTSPFPPAPRSQPPPLTTSTSAPVNPTGLFQYGFPGPICDLRPAPSLASAYDRRTRNPAWVAEHITPASLAANHADRRNSVFVEDLSIPEKFRGKLKDYARSGYDRGHQVPAADAKWSQEAMDATFALSNMCPQVGEGFNRDYWAHFEDFCRRLTTTYPSVRIVTGPLYLPRRDPVDNKWRVSYEVIGSPPNIAVPTHFYKVVLAEDGRAGGSVAVGAFVLPNAPIANAKPLADFEVPVEAVERASGLEFASLLPAERRKRLCQEVHCSIIVKEYADRQKSVKGTNPRKGLPAPS
ncbi:DNA/RNA non-specific endonuclease [Cryomyces antarcticus]|nr:nuclease [Oleoguttula sp. CCFEE 6159]